MPAVAVDARYPVTPKRPVSDTYHGVTVVDDYRWLEDDANAEVKRWAAEQNAATRRYFDGIAQRPAIAARVGELLRSAPMQHYDFEYRKQLFAMKSQPPKNQPLLVVLPPSADVGAERVILDPNELDDGNGRTTIDFYKPSYDGRYVAVSLSENDSEEGSAYVYDTSTGYCHSSTCTYPSAAETPGVALHPSFDLSRGAVRAGAHGTNLDATGAGRRAL